jgi:hypothetical protein
MHSKHNEDYTIHYNGDFSMVLCGDNKTDTESEIPPALFALLYAAIAEDIRGKQDDLLSDLIWEQERMGARNQSLWKEETNKEKNYDI